MDFLDLREAHPPHCMYVHICLKNNLIHDENMQLFNGLFM